MKKILLFIFSFILFASCNENLEIDPCGKERQNLILLLMLVQQNSEDKSNQENENVLIALSAFHCLQDKEKKEQNKSLILKIAEGITGH